jgi:lactam utilization protein B
LENNDTAVEWGGVAGVAIGQHVEMRDRMGLGDRIAQRERKGQRDIKGQR